MIETHAHIYDEQFGTDRADLIQRAKDLGVKQIWMPNCNSETIDGMLALEMQYPDLCFPMMGLHPSYVDADYEKELEVVSGYLSNRKFIMIGEIGIDFYWDLAYVKEQEKAFFTQLEWAKEYEVPICIHSRNSKDGSMNAIQRCCDLIEEFGWKDLRGIFHCFSGNIEDAQRVTDLNFLLGIGGVVTFKNGKIDQFLREIDLSKIVLETDAPYLAPVPHRGKRNEPAYLELVVDKLCDVYSVSATEIIRATSRNAENLIR